MLRRINKKIKAQAAVEYVSIVVLFALAFFVFQKFIVRGFAGRWKSAADQLGKGHQYDPIKTLDCAYDEYFPAVGGWYNAACFQDSCIPHCIRETSKRADFCSTCIASCNPSGICNDPP